MCSGRLRCCLCIRPWSVSEPSYVFCTSRALSLVLSLATLIVFYAFFVSCMGEKKHKKAKMEKKKHRTEDKSKAKPE